MHESANQIASPECVIEHTLMKFLPETHVSPVPTAVGTRDSNLNGNLVPCGSTNCLCIRVIRKRECFQYISTGTHVAWKRGKKKKSHQTSSNVATSLIRADVAVGEPLVLSKEIGFMRITEWKSL